VIARTAASLLVIVLLGANQPADARVTGLPDFTELVEETGPAVVNIRVTQFGERARAPEAGAESPHSREDMPEFFRRFFDTPGRPNFGRPDRRGAGSGFIIEPDGYIVTNHHVIDGADQIIVRMADRREFEAELVGSDELSDIALLKIDANGLPTLTLGDSKQLKPGEWVVAIGSPFNFEQSVTAGIVSAKGRSTNQQQYVPFIQTDVAIPEFRWRLYGPVLLDPDRDGEKHVAATAGDRQGRARAAWRPGRAGQS
jgi:serine protease Do